MKKSFDDMQHEQVFEYQRTQCQMTKCFAKNERVKNAIRRPHGEPSFDGHRLILKGFSKPLDLFNKNQAVTKMVELTHKPGFVSLANKSDNHSSRP